MELDHPFPLIRSGGAFLIIAGAIFALGWIWPKRFSVFMALAFSLAGFGAYAALALPPDLGSPPLLHIAVLAGAVVFEIIAIAVLYHRVKNERRADAWMLVIVGAHFLPMVIAFGPIVGAMALLCMANGAIALAREQTPILPFGLADSALKIAFGAWMFIAYPNLMGWLALS